VVRADPGVGVRQELVLDPVDHRYLGDRTVLLDPGRTDALLHAGSPYRSPRPALEVAAGTVLSSSAALSTAVVDSVPDLGMDHTGTCGNP
jgi:hypothetical protein